MRVRVYGIIHTRQSNGALPTTEGFNMTDKTASQKALELIMLQRAKQQAYYFLAHTAVEGKAEYWEKANNACDIMEALIDMAIKTGLLTYTDCDMWSIKLIDTSDKEA